MIEQTPNISPYGSARRRRAAHLINTRTPSDTINSLSRNDDEKEKRQRKRSLLLSNNILSPIAGHSTPRRSATGSLTSDLDPERTHIGLTYAQLKEHNANCVKLSSENKINSKNAFALHLIDYMKVLVRQSQKEDSTTNFQVASCTLDAGAKIYAGRVDSVHADAYKMLGSLGRATEMPSGEEDNADQGDPQQQNKQKQKKKTNTGPCKKIEKNIKSLNCDNFDMTFEVDPFFHKTSATFDEGGTSGLLFNNLVITEESYELMLDSRKQMKSDEDAVADSDPTQMNLAPFKDISKRLFENELELCSQFANFRFTEWDRNAEDLISGQSQKSFTEENDHRFDMDASALEPEGGVEDMSDYEAGGDCGNDEPFIDASSLGDGREAVMAVNGSSRMNSMAAGSTVGSLQLEFSLQPSEYSYFRQDILDTWAGPQHWKLKARSKDSCKSASDANESNKRKRQKKTAFSFNYESDTNTQGIIDPGKAVKTLAKSTLDKLSVLLTTLPDDLHYDPDNFTKLFLNPFIEVTRKFLPQENEDSECCNYNYDNEYDRENFCPDLQNDDDDDDDDADAEAGPNMTFDMMDNATPTPGFDLTYAGENLVSQPNKVEKIQMSYAKTAKRIDIKKLKKVIWESLTVEDNNNDKENLEVTMEEQRPLVKQLEDRKMTEPQSFKGIYSSIPNRVSQNVSKNLSVPIAFVCMLYLANEKDLKLTASEDMSDFKVSKDNFETPLK